MLIVNPNPLACRPESQATVLVDGTDDQPAVCVGDDGQYFTVDSAEVLPITAEEALAIWMDADDKLGDDQPAVMKMFYDVKYGN
jgi:hypothetical protein